MKLYEIDAAIMECVDEDTGEVINIERLNELQMARDNKIENICLWIKNLMAELEAIKKEKQSFNDRQKQKENKIEDLKNYLKYALQGQNFETSKCKVSFRKTNSVEVLDFRPEELKKIDESLVRETIEVEPNKKKISEMLKNNQQVPGCVLVEGKSITIK